MSTMKSFAIPAVLSFSILVLSNLSKIVTSQNVQLPSNLKICNNLQLHGQNFDECVRNSFEKLLTTPNLNKESGIKVPVFDPYFLKMARFDFSNLNFQLLSGGGFDVKNLAVLGFRNSRVMRVKTNFTEDSLQLLSKLSLPQLFLTGFFGPDKPNPSYYEPRGQFNLTLNDVDVRAYLKGRTVNAGGRKVMNLFGLTLKCDSENLKVSISGLLQDPNLNRVVNELINANSKLVYDIFIGRILQQLEPGLLMTSNLILHQLSWDSIYLSPPK